MARKDADALLLQVSADISKLQKQFDKAVDTVNSGSKKMEDRASRFAKTFGNANDNAVQKFAHGIGQVAGESIAEFAQQSGRATTLLEGFGAAGVAAAAVLGGLVVVLGQAKAAVAFGDAIADSAAKVGVSTDTLQEYRYAIHQVGGDYDDADEALSKFTQTLGKAELGFSKKAMKPFAALGLTKEDLENFKSADDALKVILERLAGIQDERKRQGLAAALGLEKFIPLAREGAGRLDELRASAHRLGYVMDADLVAKAGEANDKLEDLQAVANVQLKSAFVDLAPVILQVAGALADAAREVNKIANDVKDAMPVLQKWFGLLAKADEFARKANPFGAAVDQVGGGVRAGLGAAAQAARAKALRESFATPTSIKSMLSGGAVAVPDDFRAVYPGKKPAPFDPIDQSGSGTKPRDTNAERTQAVNGMLASAAKDLLQAQNALTEDIESRAQLERDIAAQELAQDQARLAAAKAALDDEKGISAATRKALKAKIDEAAALAQKAADTRIDLINREADWAAEDRADDTRKALRDAEIDGLRLQANLARTREERTEIERQILKLQQDELTRMTGKQLSRLEQSGAISDEEGAARASAAAQGRANDRVQFDVDHEGPIKQYLRSIQDLDTEMQQAGVQAFEGLSSGLAGAIVNAHSLGDVGASVFRQLKVQILELLIKAGATKAASFFGFASGGYLGGFASGGGLLTGPGTSTSDSILATNGKGKFARFSDGEFVVNAAATRRNRDLLEAINSGKIGRYAAGGLLGGGGSLGGLTRQGAPVVQQFFPNFSGAVMTEDLINQFKTYADGRANQAALQGAQGGAALARQQIQKSATNRLGGRRR